MPQLRQKTISVGNQKQTVALKKKRNTFDDRGGKYMYVIEDKDTGGNLGDPVFSKSKGVREFNQSVKDIKRGMESKEEEGSEFFMPGVTDVDTQDRVGHIPGVTDIGQDKEGDSDDEFNPFTL